MPSLPSTSELEAFLVSAETLHFGRAAERLRISPSRVSQLIRRMESRVGAPLFQRTTRSVELTPIGARLRTDLTAVHSALLNALDQARSTARGLAGPLRLGYLTHCGDPELARLLARFRTDCPAARLTTTDVTGTGYFDVLRSEQIDVLVGRFTQEIPDDLTPGPVVAEEDWILALAADHPLAAAPGLDVEVLADLGIFGVPRPTGADGDGSGVGSRDGSGDGSGELFNPLYPETTPSGRPIPRRGVARTFAEVLTQVARQENAFPTAVSFPRYYTHPDVVFVPLNGWPPAVRRLVWRSDPAANSAVVEAFTALARQLSAPSRAKEPGPAPYRARTLDEGLPAG
ncbi:LysR family transcriptional regulator [Phaeacidiphilus oryzae]|uniref:LysR family transcriptional regulator n=1 Tax=Phaeacidiphilus oryzae TaxID=348818 RepID=UPI000689499A|nr:LysR family transcriptional regulator [Phaeacidiphilus oryzae]